jgi:hypothetical protein
MFFTLRDAGWRVARIVPYEFHGWIKTAWTEQIEKYVRQGWIVLPPAP